MTGRPWQIVAAVVGAVVGIVAVRYLGLNAVIPALSVAACWWAFTRLGLHRRLVLPLAVAGGHGLWFFVGMIMTLAIGGSAETLIEVGLETLIVAAIVAWGCISRSRPTLCVLIAYEVVSIGFNVIAWAGAGELRPILAVHIALRVVAIVGAALALSRWSEIVPAR
jgi:hypothetical protein